MKATAPAVVTVLRKNRQLRHNVVSLRCVNLRQKATYVRYLTLPIMRQFLGANYLLENFYFYLILLFWRNSEIFYLIWKTLVVKKPDWI